MFILLLFSSFTANRSCWQAEVRRAGPAGRNWGLCKLCQAFLLLWQVVWRKSLILNPRQLGSVRGPTFKVNAPWFWPLHLRKSKNLGDLPEGCSGSAQQSLQPSEAVGNGAPAGGYQLGVGSVKHGIDGGTQRTKGANQIYVFQQGGLSKWAVQ